RSGSVGMGDAIHQVVRGPEQPSIVSELDLARIALRLPRPVHRMAQLRQDRQPEVRATGGYLEENGMDPLAQPPGLVPFRAEELVESSPVLERAAVQYLG